MTEKYVDVVLGEYNRIKVNNESCFQSRLNAGCVYTEFSLTEKLKEIKARDRDILAELGCPSVKFGALIADNKTKLTRFMSTDIKRCVASILPDSITLIKKDDTAIVTAKVKFLENMPLSSSNHLEELTATPPKIGFGLRALTTSVGAITDIKQIITWDLIPL